MGSLERFSMGRFPFLFLLLLFPVSAFAQFRAFPGTPMDARRDISGVNKALAACRGCFSKKGDFSAIVRSFLLNLSDPSKEEFSCSPLATNSSTFHLLSSLKD